MNISVIRKYLLFAVSLFINAYGIAFITKASLGTTPITSVTYVLSMFTSMTMGQWTIVINIVMILLELLFLDSGMLKKDMRVYLLQIPIALCFGVFIDCSMEMLFWLNPATYPVKSISLLTGCIILSAGIALEVQAGIAMVAGEYFVLTIARRFHADFGYTKLGVDIALVVIACLLSLTFLSGIHGVREGTVAAAFLVGPLVHFIVPYYKRIGNWTDITSNEAGNRLHKR